METIAVARNCHGVGGLLRERAYRELRQLILDGEFERIDFLSERMLARRLGMSNTPIRSAVERLQCEGIVAIGPQRGITVREPSAREMIDHIEVREALEPFIASKIAGRLTLPQQRELTANVDAYEQSLVTGDMRRLISLDGDFHLLLAKFSGNAEYERMLRQLRDRIQGVIVRISRHVPERMAESVAEHRAIAGCIIEGDRRGAAKQMARHLDAARRALAPVERGLTLDDRTSSTAR